DIYPLAPLQEGMLFHHLISTEGDPYLRRMLFSFKSRERLDAYLAAMQKVIGRHDALRTSVVWEGVSEPVQVVWRKATLPVEEVALGPSTADVAEQLYALFDPRHYRVNVREAPWLRARIAEDRDNARWLLAVALHHLGGDGTTMEVMQEEIEAYLSGKEAQLPRSLPFRNLVAHARLCVSQKEHEQFFRAMLADVEEPTAPFGLLDTQRDGGGIVERKIVLDSTLSERLRARARQLGISPASLCHLAWAQVLARVSGHDDVVFGTVLAGRMWAGEGVDRVMGLFINTLPLRVRVGQESAQASVRRVHEGLTDLLRHEHASLALAQRCSGVPAPEPLFSALLNYRHIEDVGGASTAESKQAWEGIEILQGEGLTNYPVTLSVDDFGERMGLSAQTVTPLQPQRICDYMSTALESLVEALEQAPETPVCRLAVLPQSEGERILYEWNATVRKYPQDRCVHELFAEQAARTPGAVAVVCESERLTY